MKYKDLLNSNILGDSIVSYSVNSETYRGELVVKTHLNKEINLEPEKRLIKELFGVKDLSLLAELEVEAIYADANGLRVSFKPLPGALETLVTFAHVNHFPMYF